MIKEEIIRLMEESARGLGYTIYEYGLSVRGENTHIAVRIDKIEGVSHQDCECFSRELSQRLDVAALVPNYSLEVSSPGLNRKLRNIDEYIRFIGSPVKVVVDRGDMRDTLQGTLREVSEKELIIKGEQGEFNVEISRIVQANLDY